MCAGRRNIKSIENYFVTTCNEDGEESVLDAPVIEASTSTMPVAGGSPAGQSRAGGRCRTDAVKAPVAAPAPS